MKKGYFFMIDAFMATSIIILSLILIFSYHATKPYQMQGLFLAQDTLDLLTKTKLYEVNNRMIINLTEEGNISFTGYSLLEQTAEFYATNQTKLAQDFIRNVTKNMVPVRYGFELRIYNTTDMFNQTINPGLILQNESSLVLVAKDIILGLSEDFSIWGPLTAEVILWQ